MASLRSSNSPPICFWWGTTKSSLTRWHTCMSRINLQLNLGYYCNERSWQMPFQQWHYLISKCPCSWWIPSISGMRRQMVVPCFLWQRLRCLSLPMQMNDYLQMKGGRLNHSLQLHASAVDSQQQIPAAMPRTRKYICLYPPLNPSALARFIQCLIPPLKPIRNGCLANSNIALLDFQDMSKLIHALVQKFYHTTHIPTHPYHHSQFSVWCKNNQISSWGAVTACPLLRPLLLHYLLSLLHPLLFPQQWVWRLLVVWMMV